MIRFAFCVTFFLLFACRGADSVLKASELREGKLDSSSVPGPVEYGVIFPDGYNAKAEPYPLVLLLHGGASSQRKELRSWKETLDSLWHEEKLSKLVAAMASVGKPTIEGRVRYLDFKDGSEKWESFLLGPFLEHLRAAYNVKTSREGIAVAGFSDGGFGALRFAFKYPDRFCAVAAFEPSIMPALAWTNVLPRNRFFISDALVARFYGTPVDQHYWAANNPATIATRRATAIRESPLAIYIECGDEDYLNLDEGAEFLHEILRQQKIRHEYHLVRGADHLGRTLQRRSIEGLQFLDRALHPEGPDPDSALKEMRDLWREAKHRAENR